MYIGNDMPEVTPNDLRLITLDFVRDLNSSPVENITSADVYLEVPPDLNTLIDPNSQTRLTGGVLINGSAVSQRITGLLDGIIYRFRIVAHTDQNNGPELYTHIRCRAAD